MERASCFAGHIRLGHRNHSSAAPPSGRRSRAPPRAGLGHSGSTSAQCVGDCVEEPAPQGCVRGHPRTHSKSASARWCSRPQELSRETWSVGALLPPIHREEGELVEPHNRSPVLCRPPPLSHYVILPFLWPYMSPLQAQPLPTAPQPSPQPHPLPHTLELKGSTPLPFPKRLRSLWWTGDVPKLPSAARSLCAAAFLSPLVSQKCSQTRSLRAVLTLQTLYL